MGIRVTIRDGRAGREGGEAGVTPDGQGAVLGVIDRDPPPFRMGDKIKLPDGEEVLVIGESQEIGLTGWEQTVVVGDIFEEPAADRGA